MIEEKKRKRRKHGVIKIHCNGGVPEIIAQIG